MKYLLLTYLDENAWEELSDAEKHAEMEKCRPHYERLVASGKVMEGAPLHPTKLAATVRGRNGKPLITDGPFAETREQVGGYTLVEAARREAIEIAAGFVGNSKLATIEVRPIVDFTFPE